MNSQLPTLADTLAAQGDLDDLCRDRPLVTNEIFQPNAYYGNDFAIKKYAGLRADAPLYGVLPHGIYFDPTFVWRHELDSPLPAILSYPRFRDESYRSVTRRLIVSSASPYVYASRLLQSSPPPRRRGTLYFLAHSTHHVRRERDAGTIATQLSEIGGDFAPITVNIYWKDVLLGSHIPFLERGLRVVSAGHIFDRFFLFRLHHLCSMHEFASGDAFGSHTFFSAHSGCKYVRLPGLPDLPPFGLEGVPTTSEPRVVRAPVPRIPRGIPDVRSLFAVDTVSSVEVQRAAAGYFVGADSALAPAELADLFRTLRRLDRYGYATSRNTGPVRSIPPTSWLRIGRGVKRRLRSPLLGRLARTGSKR